MRFPETYSRALAIPQIIPQAVRLRMMTPIKRQSSTVVKDCGFGGHPPRLKSLSVLN